MLIYKATNTISNKSYIGKTKTSLKSRMNSHKSKAFRKLNYHSKFYGAIRKYGFESFTWTIIDRDDNEKDLCEKEKFWISFYNTVERGYNLTAGGTGGDTLSNHPDLENIKLKIGRAGAGKTLSEEKKNQLIAIHTGAKRSKETCMRISESLKGKPSWNKGKHISEETKKKLSEYNKKNPSRGMLGKKLSEETKKKISESRKGKCNGENNHMFGKSCYIIWIEKYGKEEADRRKEVMNNKKRKKE